MGKTLERQAVEKLGKDWSNAKSTREKLLGNVREFAQFVAKQYGLEKIDNLKPKMVEAYIRGGQARGLSDSALAGKMTAVRELATAIGKQNIVPRNNKDFSIERVRVNPQNVDVTKLDEIRSALKERAAAGDRVAIMMVAADALRQAFGLRMKESLMSAAVVVRDGKDYLKVEGTKGGRPRELAIDTKARQDAVILVARTSKALGSGTGRIIPPGMTLKQAYDAQRNEWRKLGGTKANSANMHGERHLYAREMQAGGASKQEIMVELGHGENRSPAAYGVK